MRKENVQICNLYNFNDLFRTLNTTSIFISEKNVYSTFFTYSEYWTNINKFLYRSKNKTNISADVQGSYKSKNVIRLLQFYKFLAKLCWYINTRDLRGLSATRLSITFHKRPSHEKRAKSDNVKKNQNKYTYSEKLKKCETDEETDNKPLKHKKCSGCFFQ